MKPIALVNARILTASEDPAIPAVIEKGTLLLQDGKIAGVGDVSIPQDARIIDVEGSTVTPGLIDAQCHIGLAEDGVGRVGIDHNEATSPSTPDVRALDGINPGDIAFEDAVKWGVTCAQVCPGSSNVIGGQTVVIKTSGRIVDDMVVKEPAGIMAALGEDPKGGFGTTPKPPGTRMGTAAILRKALASAKDYARKKEKAQEGEKPQGRPQEPNAVQEALSKVLNKEIPLRVHCHRTDDIATAIRIAKEFDIEITLEHCAEGHKAAALIAESGFCVTTGPGIAQKSRLETRNIGFEAPVALSKAGVKVAVVTGHPSLPIQHLRICAGLCVRGGMDEEVALLAITRHAAEIAGVSDRVGSIVPGKDGDVVVWSKDPFEYDAKVRYTFIDGKSVLEDLCGGEAL